MKRRRCCYESLVAISINCEELVIVRSAILAYLLEFASFGSLL